MKCLYVEQSDIGGVVRRHWDIASCLFLYRYAEDAAASKVRLPPRSAYNLFKREAGKQILAKHPHAKFPEFGTILAAEWSKVPDAEKQEWVPNHIIYHSQEGVNSCQWQSARHALSYSCDWCHQIKSVVCFNGVYMVWQVGS